MLNTNHDLVVAILTGFMLGSLRKVWPWKTFETISETFIRETNFIPSAFTSEVLIAILVMLLGIAAITFIERFAVQREDKTEMS
jgi:putative membrane protein